MKNIDFYFSIGSTYTYLTVTRILDVEKKHQIKFNWKPLSVRVIMKEMDNIPFPKDKINKLGHTDKTSDEAIYGPLAHTILSAVLCYGLADKIYI